MGKQEKSEERDADSTAYITESSRNSNEQQDTLTNTNRSDFRVWSIGFS